MEIAYEDGQQFFNDALSRLGERRGAIIRTRTIVSLRALTPWVRGLFKRMHPARVPHSRSPGRASFTDNRGPDVAPDTAIRYPRTAFSIVRRS